MIVDTTVLMTLDNDTEAPASVHFAMRLAEMNRSAA